MPDNNNGSNRIETLRSIRALGFCYWYFCHSNLPFGWAQGGESLDFAQDREPVERLVEPFRVSCFGFQF